MGSNQSRKKTNDQRLPPSLCPQVGRPRKEGSIPSRGFRKTGRGWRCDVGAFVAEVWCAGIGGYAGFEWVVWHSDQDGDGAFTEDARGFVDETEMPGQSTGYRRLRARARAGTLALTVAGTLERMAVVALLAQEDSDG